MSDLGTPRLYSVIDLDGIDEELGPSDRDVDTLFDMAPFGWSEPTEFPDDDLDEEWALFDAAQTIELKVVEAEEPTLVGRPPVQIVCASPPPPPRGPRLPWHPRGAS